MSLSISWSVAIGDTSAPSVINEVAGVSIDQDIEFFAPSRQVATVDLINTTGKFTPRAGGGTGTYADLDWFGSMVSIRANVNLVQIAYVFEGLISDFEIVDDGRVSMVRITAVDAATVLGRSLAPDLSVAASGPLDEAIANTIAAWQNEDQLPRFGESQTTLRALLVSEGDGPQCDPGLVSQDQTVADALTRQVMPTGLSAMWATRIFRRDLGGGSFSTNYDFLCAGMHMNRADRYPSSTDYFEPYTFQFNEVESATPDITFSELQVGFVADRFFNVATMKQSGDATAYAATNTTSVQTYGAQTFQSSETVVAIETTLSTVADDLVNRFGDIVYQPRSLSTTQGMLRSLDSSTAIPIANLLDAAGLLQRASVTWTPTGASSSITADVVIVGRSIKVNPEDALIEFRFCRAADLLVFTLDDSTLGVLDQNRLGISS